MKTRSLFTFMIVLLAAHFVVAEVDRYATIAGDPHLDVVPRTDAERIRIAEVVAFPNEFTASQRFEERPAGAATVRVTPDSNAFSQPSENLSFDDELNFRVGNGLFRKIWVSSPSSTLASDGLGPLFNARSCQRCHIKDGRGHVPEGTNDTAISMFLRVSVPDVVATLHAIEGYHGTAPDPNYGEQLQDFSLPGITPEYSLHITYEDIEVQMAGGEIATLRAPTYTAANLGYGPLANGAMLSPRIAPQMIGLGLLEAIPAADILALADPDDLDNDGISGRPNIVWSLEFDRPMLGRFGLKAGSPSIVEQSASAFAGDIGISNPLHPNGAGECMPAQTDCINAPHGDGDARGFEIDQEILDLVTFYSRNLGVPARRNMDDVDVLRGKDLFYNAGCVACHQPSFVTNRLADQPAQSFQLIWPYTDMLLHDMGDGLADNRPEAVANGREWRTPPLWGIGLTEQVSGHTQLLHDGRARSLLEAVLWHGGEAQATRDRVVEMSPDDRAALLKFLESL
jgi:CxxC motif-containing protein (DUF1111 family)